MNVAGLFLLTEREGKNGKGKDNHIFLSRMWI